MDDQLPELLWASLVVATLPRADSLAKFRDIASIAREYRDKADNCMGVNQSDIALSGEDLFNRIASCILSHPLGYIALRPLLLFDKLPGYKRWAKKLDVEPDHSDWEKVTGAISSTINHQSQEATDCRWLSVLFMIAVGRLHFNREQKEIAEEILFYPNKGEITKFRPTIRALEASVRDKGRLKSTWPEDFWKTCYDNTPCLRFGPPKAALAQSTDINPQKAKALGVELYRHFYRTMNSTAMDAKHDACFGFAKFSLNILNELLLSENRSAIVGRLALRAVVEAYITFAYLVKTDDEKHWSVFRNYGSGQAKLAFLKLDESVGELPRYVDHRTLEDLANEDAYQEFVPINLGNWDKMDLRKMAEKAGCKDIYNKYYAWSSAYAHANWGSLRDSGFETCLNPLHRFHRVPRRARRILEDVIPDVCMLVDKILDLLDLEYPAIKERLGMRKVI
jgi:hypothetical protein